MAKSALRWVFVAVVAMVVFGVSGCGGGAKSPLAPDPGTLPGGPSDLGKHVFFLGNTPGSNAELRAGDGISLSIKAEGFSNGTVYYGFVLRREDGMERPLGCSRTTAGLATENLGMTIPKGDAFWQGGHTFDAVAVAHFNTAPPPPGTVQPTCPYYTGQFPNFVINWGEVHYRANAPTPLNWRLMAQ